MLKKLLAAAFWMLLIFPVTGALAQTGTVTGTVADSLTGNPVPGVNVVVSGTQIGAATGPNGTYEVSNVPAGQQTLVASFVGYETKRVPVTVEEGTATTANINLTSAAVGLDAMVVTALGIERSERSVTASVQQVGGADLAEVENDNFISSLEGRVSGVDIRTSSTMGGSSNINIRGFTSLSGENQPLIVIDGIPIDNSTNQSASGISGGFSGFDYGNAAQSINPSNVKSVSVLKGASAAALYGSRGANGVIQITTKNGAGEDGLGISFTSSVRAAQPYELMEYQNEYGGGAEGNPFTTMTGSTFRLDGEGDQLVADFATDESWGPRLDGRMVREWYSFDNLNGVEGQTTPWDAHSDNIENFLSGSGLTFDNNLALSQATENFNYRLGLNWLTGESIFPNSSRDEYRISFNGSTDLGEKVTATATANYSYRDLQGRVSTGYFCQNLTCAPSANPFAQFNTFGQRQIDLGPDSPMRTFRRPNGQQRGWNFLGVQGARNGVFNFTDNPYISRYANVNGDDEQRIYGKAQVAYDFLPNFTASWKVASDYRTERRSFRVAEISVENPERFRENLIEAQEINSELKVNYDRQLTDNFSLSTFVAGRIRWENFDFSQGETRGGLAAPGLFNLENSIGRPFLIDNFSQQQVNSVYGDVSLGYRDMVYLTASLRNDWASTLPEDDNSFIYPSIGGNFIFTELEALQGQNILSFGKVRASWAQVGNSADPFQLTTVFPVNTPFGEQPLQQADRVSPNPELTREITTEVEVGVDLRFFSERIVLNAAYYDRSTDDQILQSDISATSGFSAAAINAGEITNTGVEASITATPVLTQNFQWDITANWATNENKVEELAEGIENFVLGGIVFGPDVVAPEGGTYGTFFGTKLVRDANGEIVYNRNGTPRTFAGQRDLGDFQAEWTGGLSTRISYKGFSASALVDMQMGGQIWSLSNLFGTFSGLVESTLEGRETGVLPGGVVLPEGTADSLASTTVGTPYGEAEGTVGRVGASPFWKSHFGVDDAFLFDATHAKLREISLSYRLPQQWLNSLSSVPISGATITLTGGNLLTLYKEVPNIDPSLTLSTGNVQGVEAGQNPIQRTFGARINLQF